MSETCLACGAARLRPLLDLGAQPLANDFRPTDTEPEAVYPLAVVLCPECHHVQLDYFIDPDLMFKHYLYVSGTSDTYRKYLDWFAEFTGAGPGSRVLDIGCNDGTQLDMFKKRGAMTWGVDPAENLFPTSSQRHNVHLGYFDSKYEPGGTFDIINAQNVFAHNRDPLGFLLNCKRLMHDASRVYIQTSQADMVPNGEFDTIYHEHINFFNTLSFKKLVERAGLVLTDVRKTQIHGTSYMFVIGKTGPVLDSVEEHLKTEIQTGLQDFQFYEKWATNCRALAERVRVELADKYVVAYGAAAKGNTFLNFVKVKPVVIVDDNPLKQGRFSPGVRSPVVTRDWIATIPKERPVTFLPLAWNLFDEIKSNIQKIRNEPCDEYYRVT